MDQPKGPVFKDEDIALDGGRFVDASFTDCVLVYSGGPPPHIFCCSFERCDFRFEGAAINTIAFLQFIGTTQGGLELLMRDILRIQR